ncbi:hypothetical protein ASE01_00625 [Nocardioides sp. Root190]|uniref:universal stress protein n=1 Tax=Nocardioides sp. Root190 TaxID=1736488 RepID=UPI0007124202|nr:universal stress protein [Nocardioides sp. Root190]KRB80048.1 hypothetical protein ASE01_00625 [Nocardioides sp. Root190]
MTQRGVVVGFDGSADAEAALAWGAETARSCHLPLEVVIVASRIDGDERRHRAHLEEPVDAWRTSALSRLTELAVADGEVEIRYGPIVPGLLDASIGAAILAVGSSGHGLTSGTLTGSVSQHVARHATCPVVVVRPQRSPHARRIVVGVDGSVESARALRFACERAAVSGEPVIAVHGYDTLSNRMVAIDGIAAKPATDASAAAEILVNDLAVEVSAEFADVRVEPVAIQSQRPGQVLVAASAGASLVVVGSRGRDAFTELMMGSVSQHVLHHAECPVAVVR